MARFAALIAPPRQQRDRYDAVLAPLRRDTPRSPRTGAARRRWTPRPLPCPAKPRPGTEPGASRRAILLARLFVTFPWVCPQCGAQLRPRWRGSRLTAPDVPDRARPMPTATLHLEAELPLRPRALRERFWTRGWLERQLDLGQGHCLLDLLVEVFYGGSWDLKTWDALQPDSVDPQETSGPDRFVVKLLSQVDRLPAINTDQAQTGLLLACTMGSAENIDKWAGQVGALSDSGLVRLHLDMPGNRLWQAASPESLAILLRHAMSKKSEEWRESRLQIEERLPDLLRTRPDYAECLVALTLDLDVAPGP